jgi:hypothetical protein
VLVEAGLIAAIAILCGGALALQGRRCAAANRERARLAAAWAAQEAALAAGPLALYLFRNASAESFVAGGIAALGAPERDFAELAARFTPADAAALEGAVTQLRQAGTPFHMRARLARDGAAVAIAGRRLASAAGESLGDAVWFADAAAHAAAERERDGLRALIDALPLPIWRRREAD